VSDAIHVLLAEDDADVRETTALLLTRHGFRVTAVPDGVAALDELAGAALDVAVLDIAMPRLDGLSLVRRLEDDHPPVILLTARDLPSDVVTGLTSGADDYVTKPFDVEVLIARIEALVRRTRTTAQDPTVERLADLVVDRTAKQVSRDGVPVPLSATEFRVLETFLDNRGVVLSRDRVVELAWDSAWQDPRVVDTNVQRLRKKLGADVVETVRGFGYRVARERR
jgi:DNA-binding response OmpR family regulator